jgi:hypothetical protein
MPRISAEARAASAYEAVRRRPGPPKDFSPQEINLWRDIIRSKPAGWFDAGSLPLLEQYCRSIPIASDAAKEAKSLDKDAVSRLATLNTSIAMLATKLRLSVQAAVDRRNRILDEEGAGEKAGDHLLGGKAVWGNKLRAVG